MAPDEIEALFTRDTGEYAFARWGRPVVPVVFGVDDATLGVVKGAFEAMAVLSGHKLAETDPELGGNCLVFFLRDWTELVHVPDLVRLLPDLAELTARLDAAGARQYRLFHFDEAGAIRAAFVFLRMDEEMLAIPAEDLALAQVTQVWLLWADVAFPDRSPLAVAGGRTILRPEIGDVIRAGYDPVLPAAARDPSHALRLAARLGS